MANKGVRRGIGQPGSRFEQVPNLWGGGNPLLDSSTSSGDLRNYPGYRPIPYYFLIKGGPTTVGGAGVGVGINDYRYVPQSVPSSGVFADNTSAMKIWMQPTFGPGVTDYSHTGISVGGFIGQGTQGTVPSSSGYICAYGMHLDTGMPVFGMYGLQIHLGLLAVSATEAVGIDLSAMNGFSGTFTNGIFLRNNDGQMGAVVNKWNFQLTYAPSQHRGPFGVGGLTTTTLPGSVPNTNVAGAGSMLDVSNHPIMAGGSAFAADAFAINAVPASSSFGVANCTYSIGSLTVTSSAGFGSVVAGQYLVGQGIIPGTTVTNVASSSSITISLPPTVNSTTLTLNFLTIGEFQVASTLASSTTVTSLALFGSVVAGQWVQGPGIQPNTTVTAVGSSSSITISTAATATGAATLTFFTVSPPRMGTQLGWVQTTNASVTQIYGVNPPGSVVQHYRARVWARRTGGSGSANDSVAFSGDFLVSNQTLTGSPRNSASLEPVAMGTIPASTTTAGSCTTVAGSETVTSTSLFANVLVGSLVSGAGIPPGAWVIAKASSSSITISQPASAASTTVALTYSAYTTAIGASIFGTVIQVQGPATTNVTWHCEVENSGYIGN